MNKKYESPEFSIEKITFSADILTISEGEIGKTSGFIEDPGEDMEIQE